MLTFTLPAVFSGDRFADDLAAAGLPVTRSDVYVIGDQVVVASLDDGQKAQAQQALASHVLPIQADPVDALLVEVNKATTLAAMKAALVKGLPAAIRGR